MLTDSLSSLQCLHSSGATTVKAIPWFPLASVCKHTSNLRLFTVHEKHSLLRGSAACFRTEDRMRAERDTEKIRRLSDAVAESAGSV